MAQDNETFMENEASASAPLLHDRPWWERVTPALKDLRTVPENREAAAFGEFLKRDLSAREPYLSPGELLWAFDSTAMREGNIYSLVLAIADSIRKGGPDRTLTAIGDGVELSRDLVGALFLDWLEGRFMDCFPLSNRTLAMLRPLAWRISRLDKAKAAMAKALFETVFASATLDSWVRVRAKRRRKRRNRKNMPLKSMSPVPPSRENPGASSFLPDLGFLFAPRPIDLLFAFAQEADRSSDGEHMLRSVMEFAGESDLPRFVSQLSAEKDLSPEQVLAMLLYHLVVRLSFIVRRPSQHMLEEVVNTVPDVMEFSFGELFDCCFPCLEREKWAPAKEIP